MPSAFTGWGWIIYGTFMLASICWLYRITVEPIPELIVFPGVLPPAGEVVAQYLPTSRPYRNATLLDTFTQNHPWWQKQPYLPRKDIRKPRKSLWGRGLEQFKPTCNKATKEGAAVRKLMIAPPVLNKGKDKYASLYWEYNAIGRWGWKLETEEKAAVRGIEPQLKQMKIAQAADPKVVRKVWRHVGTSTNSGDTFPPTHAIYSTVFWPQHGLIVIERSKSPESAVAAAKKDKTLSWKKKDKVLASYAEWSDLTALTWAETVAVSEGRDLNYVMQELIADANTKDIISTALKKAAKDVDGKAPKWPGALLKPEDAGWDALLGVPPFQDIANMLVGHRAQLGHKSFKSIQIWNGVENESAAWLPSTIVQIVDTEPRSPATSSGSRIQPRKKLDVSKLKPFKEQRLYNRYVKKGTRLQKAFTDPDATTVPRTSPYQDYGDFGKWGWTETARDNKNFKHIAVQLESIGIKDTDKDNVQVMWKHTMETEQRGRKYPATYGEYSNVYWPEAGLIMAMDNHSPESRTSSDGAKKGSSSKKAKSGHPMPIGLARWSDSVYLTWKHYATKPEQLKGLKFIMRRTIENEGTRLAIQTSLKKGKKTVDKDGIPPVWPGVTFTPKDKGWEGLLGCDNVQGIAYMLLQRVDDLGRKDIKSLQVWNDLPIGKWAPSIIATIGDIETSPQAVTRSVERRTEGCTACEETLDAASGFALRSLPETELEHSASTMKRDSDGISEKRSVDEQSKNPRNSVSDPIVHSNQNAELAEGGPSSCLSADTKIRSRGFVQDCVRTMKEYRRCKKKGAELRAAFRHRTEWAPVTQDTRYNDYAALTDWGWRKTTERNKNYAHIAAHLAEMGVTNSSSGNIHVTWGHTRETTHAGKKYPPTLGEYSNTFWPQNGVIMADNNHSPESRAGTDPYPKFPWSKPPEKPTVPALARWSDVVFLTWMQHALMRNGRETSNRKNLKYVFRRCIKNTSTKTMISLAVKLLPKEGKVGAKGDAPPPWPGVWFYEESLGWEALIGSDLVQGVAYLLLQHPTELGLGIIEAIQVWTDEHEGPGTWTPSMIIRIAPYDSLYYGRRVTALSQGHPYTTDVGALEAAQFHPPGGRSSVARRADKKVVGDETPAQQPEAEKVLVAKGEKLRLGMQNPLTLPAEDRSARFTRYQDLEKWGYERFPIQLSAAGEAEHLEERLRIVVKGLNLGRGTKVKWEHSKSTQHKDAPTEARFENTFYPSGGLIIASANYGPLSTSPGVQPAPELRHWSDIVYLSYAYFVPSPQLRKLRYVLCEGVLNKITKKTIKKAVRSQFHEELKTWPGRLFTPEMHGFNTLLETPLVSGVCWLLIQHRETLGHKEVKSIRAYEGSGMSWPRLFIEIGDVKEVEKKVQPRLIAGEITGRRHGLSRRGDPTGGSSAGGENKEITGVILTPEQLKDATDKGKLLLSYMEGKATPPIAKATSRFTKFEQLAEWGWTRYVDQEVDERDSGQEYTRKLKQVGINVDLTSSKGLDIGYEHDKPVKVGGNTYPAGEATYQNSFYKSAGVILANFNFGPRHMKYRDKDQPVIELEHWSDVAFLVWESIAGNGDLRYVLVERVVNDQTKDIVKAALVANGQTDGWPGYWDGFLFTPQSKGFETIVASPKVSGTCWLLIQHKKEWGERTIKSIRVWVDEHSPKADYDPFMLVEIGPAQIGKRPLSPVSPEKAKKIPKLSQQHGQKRADAAPGTAAPSTPKAPSAAVVEYNAKLARKLDEATLKGRVSLSHLNGEAQSPLEKRTSPFTRYEQLAEWGWVKNINDGSVDKGSYSKIFEKVGIKVNLRRPGGKDIAYKYDKHVKKDGVLYEATDGDYDNTYWKSAGVIFAQSNYGPNSENTIPDNPMPKLQHWSDVTFLAWQELSGKGELRYVVRDQVVASDTKDILKASSRANGIESTDTDRPPEWPGILLQPGINGFEALLSTSSVSGVCCMLIQHEPQWGQRSIKSVRAWSRPDGVTQRTKPNAINLLIEIIDRPVAAGAQQEGSERPVFPGPEGVAGSSNQDSVKRPLSPESPQAPRKYQRPPHKRDLPSGGLKRHSTRAKALRRRRPVGDWEDVDDGSGHSADQSHKTADQEQYQREMTVHDKKMAGYLEKATPKGKNLLAYMEGTAPPPAAKATSEFTRYGQLAENGWSREVQGSRDGKTGNIVGKLKEAFKVDLDLKRPRGPEIMFTHDKQTIQKGKKIPATDGEYRNTYWKSKGVLVAPWNYSPRHMTENNPRKPIPALEHWSDVVFLAWENLPGTGDLRYVIRNNVEAGESVNLMMAAMAARGLKARRPGVWPGEVWYKGREGFEGLLQAPNIRGICWLLIQHKKQWGSKVIESMRFWSDQLPEEEANVFQILVEVSEGVKGHEPPELVAAPKPADPKADQTPGKPAEIVVPQRPKHPRERERSLPDGSSAGTYSFADLGIADVGSGKGSHDSQGHQDSSQHLDRPRTRKSRHTAANNHGTRPSELPPNPPPKRALVDRDFDNAVPYYRSFGEGPRVEETEAESPVLKTSTPGSSKGESWVHRLSKARSPADTRLMAQQLKESILHEEARGGQSDGEDLMEGVSSQDLLDDVDEEEDQNGDGADLGWRGGELK